MKALVTLALVLILAAETRAVDLQWSTADGGGTAGSTGGGYRMGGTIGQADAGASAAEGVILVAGFWAIAQRRASVATPTPTASATRTVSASATATSTASATPTRTSITQTATPTSTSPLPSTATPTGTPTASPATATPTSTATPTPTDTPEVQQCVGDCDRNEQVTVDELVLVVNVALGSSSLQRCTPCDADGDSNVSISEIVGAVDCALNGCPSQRTPEPGRGDAGKQ